jgi:hypothetical protein
MDPTCGDGVCEAPFEFASFSRFGCKADCGRLSDLQNLTSAQVDVYWDFTHQAGSLPAAVRARVCIYLRSCVAVVVWWGDRGCSIHNICPCATPHWSHVLLPSLLPSQELMRQASWNLCPQAIDYNTACYDNPDNSFSTISGSLSKHMPDLPDGDWALVVKKDIFEKAGDTQSAALLLPPPFAELHCMYMVWHPPPLPLPPFSAHAPPCCYCCRRVVQCVIPQSWQRLPFGTRRMWLQWQPAQSRRARLHCSTLLWLCSTRQCCVPCRLCGWIQTLVRAGGTHLMPDNSSTQHVYVAPTSLACLPEHWGTAPQLHT